MYTHAYSSLFESMNHVDTTSHSKHDYIVVILESKPQRLRGGHYM